MTATNTQAKTAITTQTMTSKRAHERLHKSDDRYQRTRDDWQKAHERLHTSDDRYLHTHTHTQASDDRNGACATRHYTPFFSLANVGAIHPQPQTSSNI